MITMEFDELQKIWDKQNNEPLYVINEEALHNRVKAKKNAAAKKANWMERILIGANLLASSMLLWAIIFKGKDQERFIYIMLAVMLITPIWILYKRMQRKKVENRFELTLLGDLEHALSNTSYTVALSQAGRVYFILIAVLTLMSKIFDRSSSLVSVIGISIFFILVWFASRWEHGIYVRKKKELINLKAKMEADVEQ